MKAVVGAVMLALAVLSGAGAAIVTAAPASASVLVNADSGTIRLGQALQLGVYDQPGRGGPDGYWAGVWSLPGAQVDFRPQRPRGGGLLGVLVRQAAEAR